MGHYAGLLELGPEVLGARGLPVYCTTAVADVLAENAPWSLLVSRGNVQLCPIVPGRPFELADGLSVEAFRVPHRDEFGDTVGFIVSRAGGRRLVYVPDADSWSGLARPLRDLVADSDVAVLDGTFFDRSELAGLTGRDQGEVPHPPVAATVEQLDGMLDRVVFTHLNHTNPLIDPCSPQSHRLVERGARVAIEGMRLDL
jgi:pyrroloquinoline quinone biosynthesis protein B